MQLYFHHVGESGSKRDFPRTVWNEVSIKTVEENIPLDDPHRSSLLRDLYSRFPHGRFNVWGVPQGASTVIKKLSAGDAVLLVESIRLAGSVPALCPVGVFCPRPLSKLSTALWGEAHFPYVFFFHTQALNLSWDELKEHLGYAPRFDPRGQFYSVKVGKPAEFPSHATFVDWLLKNRAAAQQGLQGSTSPPPAGPRP
jgi:5-methylcytosine-specific restriction protein A